MARVLVIGGGIAGLWTAVKAADAGHEVEVVTKTALGEGSTRHAQGGIAAALFPDDSAGRHAADTLEAGAGLADPEAVAVLCAEGPARVRDLIRFGVAFDGGESGLARGLEAAHSRARILHAGGDATGAAIEQALVETVRRRAVRITEHAMLIDLIVDGDDTVGRGRRVIGAVVLDASGERVALHADTVVLATGGSGCLYRHTTNPAVATGDGVAAAWRAGAAVADLEFTQFHPTALAAPGTPLISEAVRGEGAVLRDARGERFMLEIDPRAELAPRDVVARAVWRRMREQGGAPVFLDATCLDATDPDATGPDALATGTAVADATAADVTAEDASSLGAGRLARRFPGIDRVVREAGFDWSREPVPVTPAAHYAMGGIVTDLDARTSLPGLLAVGECARTGVHGANRLASNSLLEAAVFADRAVRSLSDARPGEVLSCDPLPNVGSTTRHAVPEGVLPGVSSGRSDISVRPDSPPFSRSALQELMWSRVGVERDEIGLAEASARLAAWNAPAPVDRASAEDRNLLDLARLTVDAARARRESVGAHYRTDGGETLDAASTPNPALEAA
ncbi:L-aspartate oxidase [Agromyces aerolatus]|uniref:L-aspartate oxidase n=1 Tax=Agromyces sp. LY-1074 TaxID=3074080 RepID=UPI002857F19F|nr:MULTISPECIES: FAD-dependent oxidoreductase [unclassified Agromyces]MDR5698890.1 FAD-dependent oxidoreductase [Agromyces sp. LY-1074]MDR5705332.1 FAD-dependent oxidoreductase [Agromyces sp. LY-1358]